MKNKSAWVACLGPAGLAAIVSLTALHPSDTFGPCGPFVVSGLNYDDLLLQLRQNGETKQKQRTRDMAQSVADIVSFASRFVRLEPGDLIYTGTPGITEPIRPGDVLEVEVEGVGVLRNPVRAPQD